MQHPEPEWQDDGGDRILLAQVDRSFWLLDGEAYLDAMMTGEQPYPKPVRCLTLGTVEDLRKLLPDGLQLAALWAVHPAIVTRLKQNDELMAVELIRTN